MVCRCTAHSYSEPLQRAREAAVLSLSSSFSFNTLCSPRFASNACLLRQDDAPNLWDYSGEAPVRPASSFSSKHLVRWEERRKR